MSPEKIRILEMIDHSFLGGGQINLLSLARDLNTREFDVAVCSRGDGPFVVALTAEGIRHFPISFRKRIDRRLNRDLLQIMNIFRPDIIHTHGGVAGFFGRLAARRAGIPVLVHTIHGIHYLHYRNPIMKAAYIGLERHLSAATDAVILVSEEDARTARRRRLVPGAKIHVIKNGIDFASIRPSLDVSRLRERFSREIAIDLSGPVAGTVARLHRQKDIPNLLHAAVRIHAEVPGFQCLIIGGGPIREKMEKLCRRLRADGYVHFLGERRDAVDWMSLFDVFILSSLWEGLPFVLLEAAALKKPVAATAVEGSRELIENKRTGYLVPPSDPHALARAVIDLFADPGRAAGMGALFHERISDVYTLENMTGQTRELYHSLLKQKNLGRS
jgi:glycosyltransferase involved in cell wall biosynthesis